MFFIIPKRNGYARTKKFEVSAVCRGDDLLKIKIASHSASRNIPRLRKAALGPKPNVILSILSVSGPSAITKVVGGFFQQFENHSNHI